MTFSKYIKQLGHSLLIATFLLHVLFIGSCKKGSSPSGEFSVMSYNIAGLPEPFSSSHPATYTSIISPLLNEHNIVQVQEDFCYHDSVLLFEHHPYKTQTSGCIPQGSGLNTFSDFPINNYVRVPWVTCSGFDCMTPKGFSYSQIEIRGGTFIDVYNVHANAGSSDEGCSARRGNIEQLSNYIHEHSQGKAVIVMGDFNSRYTRSLDTIRAMADLGFHDVWIDLICHHQIPDTGIANLTNCDPPRTQPDCERVDKIFYRNNGTITLEPTFYQVDDSRFYYQGNDTMPLSDHWPVFAKFNYKISE